MALKMMLADHINKGNAMTTVKEFKDLDGEFVADDELSGRRYKRIFAAEHLHDLNIRNLNTDDAKLAITSFAWRPLNTLPDNPKFKYEVNATPYQWRPLLDQSSTETLEEKEAFDKMKPYEFAEHVSDSTPKPVFTQAMSEFKAGEFVSVLPPKGVRQSKSKFLLIGFDLMGDAVIQHCCSKNISDTCKSRLIAPIDTRTPKQKAVDEALELKGFSGDLAVERHISAIYDLWNK